MCNIFWVLEGTPHVGFGARAYLVGMTISNACTAILAWFWNARMRAHAAGAHPLRRWPPIVIMLVLIYLRQKEVHMLTGWPWP